MTKQDLSVNTINGRLSSLRAGVKLAQRGDRLSLRATLPPKPGSGKVKPYQQYLPLGVYANPAGLKHAEAKALEISGLLAQRRFDWLEVEASSAADTCAAWLEKFRQAWWSQQGSAAKGQQDSAAKEKTALRWKKNFMYLGFSKLPPDKKLTAQLLGHILEKHWEPNSAGRRAACSRFARLAKFAGVPVDLSEKYGTYGVASVRRTIPSEEEVVAAIDGIKNKKWQWIAGMMACYNLRDHEAFLCSVEWREHEGQKYLVALVPEETKTGVRTAFPLPLEWVERWQLQDVRKPKVKAIVNSLYGSRTSAYFRANSIPFKPYDLRHAWALRAATKHGLPTVIAARMMGHSPQMNVNIYQRHIDQSRVEQAYFDAVKN